MEPMKTSYSLVETVRRSSRAGFSLIELLTVLTIVSILSAATIPAMQSILQSTKITQAGQTLTEQINLARQIASARNTTVQVRLIKLAQLQNASATGYNAVQLWGSPSGTAQSIALGRIMTFPPSVVISEDTTNYSKLLASTGAVTSSSTMAVPSGTASYIAFSVMPSGVIPVNNVTTAETTEMAGDLPFRGGGQLRLDQHRPRHFGRAQELPGGSDESSHGRYVGLSAMKCPLFTQRDPRPQRSLALVSVLILLVLITAVIVGFLITSGLEQTSSRSYKASSSARLMADTAINLVQGQINEATSQGMKYAWASQPGAIRTYDNTGALHQIYKLYSAQNLTTTDATKMDISTTAAGSNDMPPSTWTSSTALWVDLNASAADAQGNSHYPILDPGQASKVDGFSVNTTAGIASATSVPMPVRWLYVLQQGQIITPDTTSTGTVATFANSSVKPSAANPIVGRIAYWTDDETSKVNVNTAGGDGLATGTFPNTDPTPIANATFWDTPRFSASDETNMANVQPAANEFQRYPGHPGTVALNNVLNGLGWNLGAAPSTSFYTLTPRYALGGSTAGTVPIATATSVTLPTSPGNHLYSSVAEMLFKTDRTKSVINADDAATRQKMESARFFLTAHSQAPEVTLSGQPRVSIWPVWSTAATGKTRTPIDGVLAFTATVPGTTPSTYYFTRADSTSSTVDIALKESNGQFRNQTLLNYLDYFTSATQAIPGYGGSFDGKYTQTGKRQILAEIFDYIRTINMVDASQLVGTPSSNPWAYVKPWQGETPVTSARAANTKSRLA